MRRTAALSHMAGLSKAAKRTPKLNASPVATYAITTVTQRMHQWPSSSLAGVHRWTTCCDMQVNVGQAGCLLLFNPQDPGHDAGKDGVETMLVVVLGRRSGEGMGKPRVPALAGDVLQVPGLRELRLMWGLAVTTLSEFVLHVRGGDGVEHRDRFEFGGAVGGVVGKPAWRSPVESRPRATPSTRSPPEPGLSSRPTAASAIPRHRAGRSARNGTAAASANYASRRSYYTATTTRSSARPPAGTPQTPSSAPGWSPIPASATTFPVNCGPASRVKSARWPVRPARPSGSGGARLAS